MKRLSQGELELLQESGYSKKLIDLYVKMDNFGFLENSDVALAYKGECGDIIKFYLRINENNLIDDVKFQYIGCPALAASGSTLTAMVKGQSLEQAKAIAVEDVLIALGNLPDHDCHCATLAVTTLRKTIQKYAANKKMMLAR